MKKAMTLVGKIIINLSFTLPTSHFSKKPILWRKILVFVITIQNVLLSLYTAAIARYEQARRGYRRVVLFSMVAEAILLLVFYFLTPIHFLIIVLNLSSILLLNFYFFHEKKTSGVVKSEFSCYDTGKCVKKIVEQGRLVFCPGELVTVVEKQENGKLLIRKFNGDEYLVDSGCIEESYVHNGY